MLYPFRRYLTYCFVSILFARVVRNDEGIFFMRLRIKSQMWMRIFHWIYCAWNTDLCRSWDIFVGICTFFWGLFNLHVVFRWKPFQATLLLIHFCCWVFTPSHTIGYFVISVVLSVYTKQVCCVDIRINCLFWTKFAQCFAQNKKRILFLLGTSSISHHTSQDQQTKIKLAMW